jgi:hypothetical protein
MSQAEHQLISPFLCSCVSMAGGPHLTSSSPLLTSLSRSTRRSNSTHRFFVRPPGLSLSPPLPSCSTSRQGAQSGSPGSKAEHPKPRPPAQEPRDPARTRPCPSGPTRPGPTRRSFPDARLPCTPCSSVAPRTSTATRAARPDPEAATAAPCPCAFDTDAPRPRRAATRAKEQSRCDRPFLPALLEFNRAVFPPLNFPLHECHHADHHFLPLVLLSPSPPSINWTPSPLPARAPSLTPSLFSPSPPPVLTIAAVRGASLELVLTVRLPHRSPVRRQEPLPRTQQHHRSPSCLAGDVFEPRRSLPAESVRRRPFIQGGRQPKILIYFSKACVELIYELLF